MAKEFLADVDLRARLLLNGGAGSPGQVLTSNGTGSPATWQSTPARFDGGSAVTVLTVGTFTTVDGGSASTVLTPGTYSTIDGGDADG